MSGSLPQGEGDHSGRKVYAISGDVEGGGGGGGEGDASGPSVSGHSSLIQLSPSRPPLNTIGTPEPYAINTTQRIPDELATRMNPTEASEGANSLHPGSLDPTVSSLNPQMNSLVQTPNGSSPNSTEMGVCSNSNANNPSPFAKAAASETELLEDYFQVHSDRGELVDFENQQSDGSTTDESEYMLHCHQPRRAQSTLARNQLLIVSVLCFLFMVAEIIGGVLSNSLALVTDATHMASDLTGFIVSLTAIWMAKKQPSVRMSFGFYRTEILGALISILIIWVATVVLVFFAVDRIRHPDYEIEADEMLIVAGLGIGFNIMMGIVLHSGLVCKNCQVPHSHFGHGHSHSHGGHSHGNHSHMVNESDDDGGAVTQDASSLHPEPENINVRAAMIHVFGDLIQSIGVFIAAIIIKVQPDYKIADSICTFIFSVMVLATTIIVLYDVMIVLMEGVPRNVSYAAVKMELENIEGVETVHSLNIWSLTMDKVAVAVHLAVSEGADWTVVLRSATQLLRSKYRVFQSTVQVEPYEDVMASCNQCRLPEAGDAAAAAAAANQGCFQ